MSAARRPARDPYALLGVAADASHADIARAYRRIARAVHPDSRPGDPGAADQFQALTRAYELVSDPARRAVHDQQHPVSSASSRPRPPAAAGPALVVPPVWPLDLLAAAPPAAPSGAVRPAAALWAGPVIVQPARGGSPDLAEVLLQLLSRRAGLPW